MTKKALRQKYIMLRKALKSEEIETNSLSIANNLLSLPIWNNTYFHVFLTIKEQNEVDTAFIIPILLGKDKEVIVSTSDFDTTTMKHFLLTDNTTIAINKHKIPEPINGIQVPVSKIEVVFVPLFAFDKIGNRIGYGKGFYDKFLGECQNEVVKIGLSFFEPETEIITTYDSDIPLDFCITPTKIYKFN